MPCSKSDGDILGYMRIIDNIRRCVHTMGLKPSLSWLSASDALKRQVKCEDTGTPCLHDLPNRLAGGPFINMTQKEIHVLRNARFPGMCDDDVGAWETGSREIEESELF